MIWVKCMEKKPLELYFHIPFCEKKCLYCDFLSAPADAGTKDRYMQALLAEVEGRADEYRDYQVSSVFIGGGTPSTVGAAWMEKILGTVREHFFVQKDVEITIEVNPGTVDEERLQVYRRAGINRLSIGLQSACDGELRALGRIHTWEQFLAAYHAAVSVGFENINVDLMSALPGQTLENYHETLESVLALKPLPTHISAYSLIVEEGTPFFERRERGELILPDEECERQMYEDTKKRLSGAGFSRYEISNYARPGYECRHNCGYWRRVDYIGFGLGAASLFQNVRFHNGRDLQAYLRDSLGCREDVEQLSERERMEEFLFLGLRMTKGVSGREFQETFGRSLEEVYGPVIRKNRKDGLLYEHTEDAGGERYLALTGRGLDLASYVMSQFLFD